MPSLTRWALIRSTGSRRESMRFWKKFSWFMKSKADFPFLPCFEAVYTFWVLLYLYEKRGASKLEVSGLNLFLRENSLLRIL